MTLVAENFDTFSSKFDKAFWHAISTQYLGNLSSEAKPLILNAVYTSLLNGTYQPSKPIHYIDHDKGRGVLRRIPVLEPKDYVVYFYCLRMLEEKIAANRVSNTYGGWSLDGLLKASEDRQMRPLTGKLVLIEPSDTSIPTFSYNQYAWAAYYGDYQKKLYATLKSYISKPEQMGYVTVQFDIANFYDNIHLNLLEKNLRALADKKDVPVVDLLCHFLKYWNRDTNGYDAQQTGIPQDALSDCSRILANFYLQDYDAAISQYCSTNSSIYFRYADDQIIIARNEPEAQAALHKASLELSKLGLHINKAKVFYRSVKELIEHFSFEEFRQLHEQGGDPGVLKAVTQKYLSSDNLDRKYSLLNKILAQDISMLRYDMRTRLIADAFGEEFLTCKCRSWTLKRIYRRLAEHERIHFIDYLTVLANSKEYTSFHFEVLTFFREAKVDTTQLVERIKHLQTKWS